MAVELVEALGADTLVHGRFAEGGALTVRMPGTARIAEGDRVAFAPGQDALHLFDRASGARL